MLDGLFGMAGQIAAAAMQAAAAKEAARMQIEAAEKARAFVFSELDPAKIGPMAKEADIDRARSRLALQGSIDPALLAARYAGSEKLLKGIEEIGTGPAEAVAETAAYEALKGGGTAAALKQRLIDAAISEMDAGATLPPDVQAELVKAGLERSGSVSGAATSKGLGGNITRQMVGERALALKDKRQGKAVALSQAANSLEQSRASLLGSLFPALKANQLQNINAGAAGLAASQGAVPNAGLSGESVANIWMARVGAANKLSTEAADAAAQGALGQAQAWSGGIGAATKALTTPSSEGGLSTVGSLMSIFG